MKPRIRKIVTFVEETLVEQGRPLDPPVRRAVSAAVLENPYAGRYEDDLTPMYDMATELGAMLSERAIRALGIEARIADAPRADEIVVAVALTSGGRPHARVGGLQKDEVIGKDGLR